MEECSNEITATRKGSGMNYLAIFNFLICEVLSLVTAFFVRFLYLTLLEHNVPLRIYKGLFCAVMRYSELPWFTVIYGASCLFLSVIPFYSFIHSPRRLSLIYRFTQSLYIHD